MFLINSILFIVLYLINLSQNQSFNDYKLQVQQMVMYVAGNMSLHYERWCQNGQATCQTPSFNACLGGQPKVCDYNFPKPIMCLTQGQYISNTSNIKFPSNLDYNNLQPQDIRFVCSSAKLQTTFHAIGLQRDKKFTSLYFGNNRGLFRIIPGDYRGSDGKCDEYDPRARPWYTIAASGSKNIIILLDKSNSMNRQNKLQNAKNAIISIIDTFSISDNIGIITFQNTTQTVGQQKLTKVTNQYKQQLKQYISNIISNNGQTNFIAAFKHGLDMISSAIERGDIGCSQAQNVFLLITDGNPTEEILTAQELIDQINRYMGLKPLQFKRKIILFVYPLGTLINIEFLKKLSCSFRGIVIQSSTTFKTSTTKTTTSNISNTSSSSSSSTSSSSSSSSSAPQQYWQLSSSSAVVTQLQQFYKYLSVGVHFDRPIWTQPYYDYYGYGYMVTVSMPAYYIDKSTNLTMLLGVAGVDIRMEQFNNFGYSQSDVVIKLIGESACQKNRLTDCRQRSYMQQMVFFNILYYYYLLLYNLLYYHIVVLYYAIVVVDNNRNQIVVIWEQQQYRNIRIQYNIKYKNNKQNIIQIQEYKNIIKQLNMSTINKYGNYNKCCGMTIVNFIIIVTISCALTIILLICILCRNKIYKICCDRTYKRVKTNSNQQKKGKDKVSSNKGRKTSSDTDIRLSKGTGYTANLRKQSLESLQTLKIVKQST